MVGLVNRALEELIVGEAGDATWKAVKEKAGLDINGFVGMDPYPDEITYRLVAAASEVLARPAEELLRAFGRHWILYTAEQGYGALLELGGGDLCEFLSNLDAVHARLRVGMPKLVPPGIECVGEDDGLRVTYRSHREGLAPMVVGLLEGLGERFETPVEVRHTLSRDPFDADPRDEFHLEFKARA
ncbi:MAG: heme NO-binding domain-containing protein [Myxococcota bacterium]|nr:heme NO-binding domain-containing protein [Myxococcota bacterium]